MYRSLLRLSVFIYVLVIASFTVSAQRDYENLLNSKEWQDMVAKGTVYLETGMYDRAMEYFKQVALKYPYIAEAQYYLGYVYYRKKDLDNAEKVFKRALKLDPEYVPASYYLALVYYDKGDNEKAVEYFNAVTGADHSFQSAYFNKGVAYTKMREPVNAIREFAYAVYLEPTDMRALEALLQVYATIKPGIPAMKEKDDPGNKVGKSAVVTEIWAREKMPIKDTAASPADHIDRAKKADIELSIVNPGCDRVFLNVDPEEEAELISKPGRPGILDITFPDPVDLGNKCVILGVRGEKGSEMIGCTIKDALTKVCPKFYIMGITSSWGDIKVDIEQKAYMYVDTGEIKKISLELVSPDEADAGEDTRVFIKDIRIK